MVIQSRNVNLVGSKVVIVNRVTRRFDDRLESLIGFLDSFFIFNSGRNIARIDDKPFYGFVVQRVRRNRFNPKPIAVFMLKPKLRSKNPFAFK